MITPILKGLQLPAPVMGAMRLLIVNGNYTKIDESDTPKKMGCCVGHGVNCFDTAWGCHHGQNACYYTAPVTLMAVPMEKRPVTCVGCAQCEAVFPQQIKVAAAMADFATRVGV